jgi:hypothetical protein
VTLRSAVQIFIASTPRTEYLAPTEGSASLGGCEACSVSGRLEQVEPVAQPAEG